MHLCRLGEHAIKIEQARGDAGGQDRDVRGTLRPLAGVRWRLRGRRQGDPVNGPTLFENFFVCRFRVHSRLLTAVIIQPFQIQEQATRRNAAQLTPHQNDGGAASPPGRINPVHRTPLGDRRNPARKESTGSRKCWRPLGACVLRRIGARCSGGPSTRCTRRRFPCGAQPRRARPRRSAQSDPGPSIETDRVGPPRRRSQQRSSVCGRIRDHGLRGRP